jgi:outer membrane protein OmpA-like peptidoglycan-associated protein
MNYLWDFDEGSRLQGEIVQHTFSENGSFNVNLRVTLKSDVSGIISNKEISKKIIVFVNKQEKDLFIAGNSSAKTGISDIRNYDNAVIKTCYSAEEAAKKDFMFGVVILSSKTQIAINSAYFRNTPRNYTVIEIYDPKDSTYNYVVDRQITLMATYPAFRDMIASGFKNTCIKLFNILDPVEKELFNLLNTFGSYSDNYFDNYGRLNSNAYLLLDQVVKILNKYPQTKLEVAAYTDLFDYPDNSQNRALSMVNYLTNRGISSKRLAAKGYGSSRPVDLDRTEQDKRLNRRIGFSIINK